MQVIWLISLIQTLFTEFFSVQMDTQNGIQTKILHFEKFAEIKTMETITWNIGYSL